MVLTNPYEKYRQQEVMTASPMELVLMLYDGCIKHLKLSCMAIEEKNMEAANHSLIRAQQILSELAMSLDYNYEIAEDLGALYDFMIRQLTEINMNKNADGIQPLIEIMADLRSAWAEVAKKTKVTLLDEE